MSTVTVQGVATDAGQSPLPGANVRVELATSGGPGYTAAGEIVAPWIGQSDSAGRWSVALTPNTAITPANTYYRVTENGAVSAIVVPASGGPYEVGAILATPPPTPSAPGITGVQVAGSGTVAGVRPEINIIAGTNVTVTAADNPGANRVDVTLSATGGAGGVTSVNGHTGAVTLAASDVGAVPATAEGAANGVATLDSGGHLTPVQAANLYSRQILIATDGVPSANTAPVGTWTPVYLMTSDTGGVWSGWITESDGTQNNAISYDFACAAGTYTLELRHLAFANRGIYTVAIDGTTVGTIDGYAASLTAARSTLAGIVIGATGQHTLTFTVATKNASSSGYNGLLERAMLTRTA